MTPASEAQATSSGAKSLSPREEISPCPCTDQRAWALYRSEALQLGVDLIATAYGGNTDFCADGHVWGYPLSWMQQVAAAGV